MVNFKSALFEAVKYQNEQLFKLQERLEKKLLIQNERIEENQNKQLKLLERIEENQNKQQLFQERMKEK